MSDSLKFTFQDSSSPLMFNISSFHDHMMVVVLMIVSVVFYIFFVFFSSTLFSRHFLKSEVLEILWTVFPCVILAFLAIPSLYTLYMVEETVKPVITIKVIGHQWYWSYEYEDYDNVEFDSYLLPVESMSGGGFRLLEVDKNVVIPLKQEIRLVITSTDVIHSWTVPCLGVKVDAIPGRLNQINLYTNRAGLFYGQCSEICGSLHAFMPICVEGVSLESYVFFVNSFN